jgi:MoxR-like ATPase
MYATIIQSAPSATVVRQTVVFACEDGTARIVNRIGGKRGSAGRYVEGAPALVPGESLVGTPVAVLLSDKDKEQLAKGEQPETCLQRIVRRVADENRIVAVDAQSTIDEVVADAQSNPASLGRFMGGAALTVASAPVAVAPVAQAVPVAEPVNAMQVPREALREIHPELRVPTLEDVSGHIERTVMGRPSVERLDRARSKGRNVLIRGHAGTGKTSEVEYYCALRGLPFVQLDCNPQTDESNIQGSWIATGNGNELAWCWSPLAELIVSGRPGVVLLNEVNRMSAKANAFFLRILEERRLLVSQYSNDDLVIPANILFVADMNPGYRGTAKMDEAMEDRFRDKWEFKYDRDLESKFIKSSSLLEFAFDIRKQNEMGKIQTPFSTRLLKTFQEDVLEDDWDYAVDNLLGNFDRGIERESVLTALQTWSSNIQDDYGISTEVGVTVNSEPDVDLFA